MLSPPASAMTVQTTLSVSATVAATCSVGNVQQAQGGATVTVGCSRGAPYELVVDDGAGRQASAARRTIAVSATDGPAVVPLTVPAPHSLVAAGLDARSVIATLIY